MGGDRASRVGGFSLVELLVVLSIIAVLGVLTVPALSGLTGAGGMNSAVSGISLVLDQARTYAMAHNTYVWVGFTKTTSPVQVTVAAVAGTTGQSTDIQTSNYTPIMKIQNYPNFELDPNVKNLSGMPTTTTGVTEIENSTESHFTEQFMGTSTTFVYVVQFNAQGEASVNTTANNLVRIGLAPVYGSTMSSSNLAAIQVSALTGQVQIFRQ
jgi:prepilin-type N-terminal cleavage/methylation domain-containing protein